MPFYEVGLVNNSCHEQMVSLPFQHDDWHLKQLWVMLKHWYLQQHGVLLAPYILNLAKKKKLEVCFNPLRKTLQKIILTGGNKQETTVEGVWLMKWVDESKHFHKGGNTKYPFRQQTTTAASAAQSRLWCVFRECRHNSATFVTSYIQTSCDVVYMMKRLLFWLIIWSWCNTYVVM